MTACPGAEGRWSLTSRQGRAHDPLVWVAPAGITELATDCCVQQHTNVEFLALFSGRSES